MAKLSKLYRVNGHHSAGPPTAELTQELRFNNADEVMEDLEETQDALNALMNLVEGHEFEDAQDCIGQILEHLGAVSTFINEKAQN